MIIGSGEHTYEVVPGWGQLPGGVQYGYTHGVQVDSQRRVYIHNSSKDAVIVFDETGKFIKAWGPEYEGNAHGLQINKEGGAEYLYLAATGRHTVTKTTLDGEVVWELGYPREAGVYQNADGYIPTNVAIAPNGDVYIADGYGQSYIHQYDRHAKYIHSFGGPGSMPGQLQCPHGLWVDTRGCEPRLVVADRSNVRLQYFTLDGKHLGFVTAELRHPCHFDQRGEELLIPDLFCRVTIFDRNNQLVLHLGDNLPAKDLPGWPNIPHSKRLPGKFSSPHAACWDADGNIYVVEWIADGRVTKLRKVDA